eukprot:2887479-Rhodomonas_salina.3
MKRTNNYCCCQTKSKIAAHPVLLSARSKAHLWRCHVEEHADFGVAAAGSEVHGSLVERAESPRVRAMLQQVPHHCHVPVRSGVLQLHAV